MRFHSPWLPLGAALLFGFPSASLAQYRAPPASEVQRLTFAGDDLRAEASSALGRGDKQEAQALFKKAIAQYEKALATDPKDLAAATGLGACATAIGEHERAVKVLAPLAEAHPNDKEVAYQLGVALFKLKRFNEAVPQLEKLADDRDPKRLIVHYYLGTYYVASQRGEAGVAALKNYLELRPRSLEANDPQIHELIGRGYLFAQRPTEARAAFQRAQAGRPESLSAQMGLEAVLELEGRLPEARKLLEGLSQRFPKAPEPRERLGRLLLAASDFTRADAVVSELLKLDAGGSAQHLLGDVRLAQKRYAEAEAALRKALNAQVAEALPVQVSLARALQAQGKNDEAIGLFEQAVQGGANSLEVWATLGSVYRRAGRYQKAIDAHQKVVQLAPNLPHGYVLLGADYYVTGQWDPAVEQYGAALKVDPQNPTAKHWLAYSLTQRARLRADQGRLSDAIRDMRRAFDLESTAVMGRNLGAALLQMKEYVEARGVLERTIKLSDASWQDHLLHGYALLGAGAHAEAVAAFDNAGKFAREPEHVSQVYAGWALAKLEVGEFDTAVQKLLEMGKTGNAAKVTQANLPYALLRRALGNLAGGDVQAATRDVEAVEKLGSKEQDVARLTAVVRSLLAVEKKDYGDAERSLRRGLSGKISWAEPSATSLLEAYVQYRSGNTTAARRKLAQVRRSLSPQASEWAALLGRAIDRREGELAYVRGSLAQSAKALKAAAEADPLNPYVQHNLACLDHRAGKYAAAVSKWEDLVASVPEASLNLGIDAQVQRKNYARAHEYYGKFLQTGTTLRVGMVRDWRDRLASIYGLEDSSRSKTEQGKAEVSP